MSTRLKAELEAKIDKWIEQQCESSDWPSMYIHPQLHEQMADAAYAVFAASKNVQEYAKEQEN